jgi:hypothetical protein
VNTPSHAPPQSVAQEKSQTAADALHTKPGGAKPVQPGQVQAHVEKSQTENGPGAVPGHAAHCQSQVGAAPASSQVKPGPGDGPPQPAAHAQAQLPVSHTVAPGQPPQSGRHSGWQVTGLQVWPAGTPPAMPQSAGQTQVSFKQTNGAGWLQTQAPWSTRSGTQ